ncbi:MAG: M28 family metallopeptidase [Thermoanaerobaculia bacterium]
MSRCTVLVLLASLMAGGQARAADQAADRVDLVPGFSPDASAIQLKTEAVLFDLLDNESTGRHFRYLTEEPHPAGSEQNRRLAEYTRDRFVEYGLEDVQLLEYEVLLPFPREVRVTMLEPFEFEASLREDGYEVDKDSWSSDVGLPYLGMSASGDVTGEVIYANSGNPADYDLLESQGIDPAGKIALVRYSMPYSYRGFKAWEAERRGVKALIIYSDPAEDGFRKGEVFPHGPWGPESHIQRGAITYDFIVPGDPLTPGRPSIEGEPRIDEAESASIPKIIAVPMSWRDAKPILENLGGPVAPHAWQGGLPFTYHVGAGPAKVQVKVDMDGKRRPIQVVTGAIRGSEEPEKVVVLGNHRDAWVYGAVDPSSGSATLLEAARILGELSKTGHRPRRTLILASWDAEEWHLTGSTEWGEHFAESLARNAIAYLNVDSSTSGSELAVGAVASLNPLIESVARDVIDPNTRHDLYDTWQRRQKSASATAVSAELVDNELGSGSDYTVFLNFLGIPVASLSFDGPYGVYHSQYDNYYWMSHFGDPGFRYMTAMAEVWGRLALRLANAEVYPFDYAGYATTVGDFLDSLNELPGTEENLELAAARKAAEAWKKEAEHLNLLVSQMLADNRDLPTERLTELNQLLLRVEREFLDSKGIPGRPWFKHILYAPRYTYAAMSLPGATEAVEQQDWRLASAQLDLLIDRLERVTELMREAQAQVQGE